MNYSFEAGSRNQIGGWSYIERSERSFIRNRSGVGRAERGLFSRKNGDRSGRTGFERGCIRDTARMQRALIGDRYALQSERVIFYPIIPDQAIKIGRHWSGVGRLSGVNVAKAFTCNVLLNIKLNSHRDMSIFLCSDIKKLFLPKFNTTFVVVTFS